MPARKASKSAPGMSPPGSGTSPVQAGPATPRTGCSFSSACSARRRIGRDLAAEHRQQRARPPPRIELEHVVAGRPPARSLAAVVVERPHAGIGPDHVGRRDRRCEVARSRHVQR